MTPSPVPGNGFLAPTSPWNSPIDANAPIDPQSPGRIAELAWAVSDAAARNVLPAVSVGSYSTPVYVVSAETPRVRVQLDNPYGGGLRRALSSGVPIPAGARAASGTDGHLTVYQPATDTLWEFWQATWQSDGWHATWGGAMPNVSSNPGYYSNSVWPGASDNEGWSWGSTATSLPVAAGLLTGADARAGQIKHAVAIAVPDACADSFRWPAQRTDGKSKSANCMPAGARLRLDPTVNVDVLPLSPVARALARAAQQYGLIVRDITNGNVAFFAEDPITAGAGAYDPAGPLGDVAHWDALKSFPWDRLQMLAARTCAAAPCDQ